MRVFRVFRLVAVLAGACSFLPTAQASDFTWTVGPDVPTPLLNSQDADAGITQSGPNLWLQTALYPTWQRYLGTTLDNLVRQPDATRDASFTQPHGDEAYWTNGIWQDATGTRYAIIHIEYDYAVPRQAFLWKRRIGLATSTNQGATWHYQGDILTTNPKRPGSPAAGYQDFGCGDTYLFVDRRAGYFYVYYMTAWVDPTTGWRTAQNMSVARCSISDKMAAGTWKKWNGTTWTESGLGGTEASVFPATDSSVVHFNTYLNAFVAIGHDSDNRSWISTSGDLATQVWTAKDYTFPQRLYWYNWPVDPVTHDRYEIGQNFRLYSAKANVDKVGTKYFNLSFSKNNNLAPTANLVLPEEPFVGSSANAICLVPSVTDGDGSIAKVEFFANQVKIGEANTAPYIFTWQNVPAGNYRISVRATDNLGAATESAGVDVSILKTLTYESWKSARGIAAKAADNSLQTNGLEVLINYGLGINTSLSLPQPILQSGKLTLSYARFRSDVSYLVERSVDFSTWSSDLVDQGAASSVYVTASTPSSSSGKLFLRIKLTRL